MTRSQAIKAWLTDSLTKATTEIWKSALATFATKAEAGANYASVSTCETAADELT